MKILPLILLVGSALWSAALLAQSPQQVNYQAIARNAETGAELINQPLDIYFTIRNNGPQGASLYEEMHSVTTNGYGLVNVQIGLGTSLSGTFAEIDWGGADKWLQVEMDRGEGIELISNTQLISVPYALHAETAGTAQTVLDVDDADADPTNEWVDSLALNEAEFFLYQAENTVSLSLNELIDDADADPTNELVDSLRLNGNSLQLFQSGAMLEISLADLVDDADADPTNELVEEGSFQLNDTMLVFVEGGITQEVSLASLINFGPWQTGEGTVFNEPENIGIGLADPEHKLHVLNNDNLADDSVAVFVESNSTAANHYGVFSRAEGGGQVRAIYGDAPGAGNNRWAGYFDRGNVHIANRLSVGEVGVAAQLSITGDSESVPVISAQTQSNTTAMVVQGDGKVGVGTAAPHSQLHVSGSVAGAVRFISAPAGSVVLGESDYMVIVDVTGGPAEVSLPPAESCEGRIYYIKRTYSTPTNNTLEIGPAMGETIDDTTFPVLLSSTSAKEAKMLVSAGENGWYIMAE